MSNDWNRNGHIGFDSLNCNKKFSVQKENAPSLFSEKYDTCITLRNIICAVKTEDYHITAKLVNLKQAATVTPSAYHQDASRHKRGTQEIVFQVKITFISFQNVGLYQ